MNDRLRTEPLAEARQHVRERGIGLIVLARGEHDQAHALAVREERMARGAACRLIIEREILEAVLAAKRTGRTRGAEDTLIARDGMRSDASEAERVGRQRGKAERCRAAALAREEVREGSDRLRLQRVELREQRVALARCGRAVRACVDERADALQ
jgi:hypothetical protein